jgi:hypothetical protein
MWISPLPLAVYEWRKINILLVRFFSDFIDTMSHNTSGLSVFVGTVLFIT